MRLPCPSHSTHVANPNFGTRYRYLNRIQIPLCTTLLLGSHFETRTRLKSSLFNSPYFETRTCLKYSPSNLYLYTTLFSGSHFETRTCLKYLPFLITPTLVLPLVLTTEYINPAGLRTFICLHHSVHRYLPQTNTLYCVHV
jgi:hypothetical protein